MIVLMYHNFHANESFDDEHGISLDAFETQITTLLDRGYSFVDPAGFEKQRSGGKQLYLTIDDGKKSSLPALEILSKHAVPNISFLTTSKIAGTPEEEFLNLDDLESIAEDGYSHFGAHGYNHRVYGKWTEWEHDLRQSQEIISRLAHGVTNQLAWPYGLSNQAMRELAESLGFTIQFGAWNGAISEKSNPLTIPRIKIDGMYTKNFLSTIEHWESGIGTFDSIVRTLFNVAKNEHRLKSMNLHKTMAQYES